MKDIYWIWLTLVKGLGPVTQKRLLECFGSPEHIYHATENDLQMLAKIPIKTLEQMKNINYLERAKHIKEQILYQDIQVLTYDMREYPDQVKKVRDFPVLLYYKAKTPLKSGGVGIVGSRRCTPYGKQVTTEAAQHLAHHKIPVISGMLKELTAMRTLFAQRLEDIQ